MGSIPASLHPSLHPPSLPLRLSRSSAGGSWSRMAQSSPPSAPWFLGSRLPLCRVLPPPPQQNPSPLSLELSTVGLPKPWGCSPGGSRGGGWRGREGPSLTLRHRCPRRVPDPQSAQPHVSHHGSLHPVPSTPPPSIAGRDAPHYSFSLLLPRRTPKSAFRKRNAACAIRTAAPGADGGVGVTAAGRIWGQRGSRAAGRGEGLGLSGGELNIFSICELNIFSILGCGGAET